MGRFRIDFTWDGSIYIHSDSVEEAMNRYYEMGLIDVLELTNFSIYDTAEAEEV